MRSKQWWTGGREQMLLRGRRNGREGKWERESEQDEEFLDIGGARLATKHSTQMPRTYCT